MPWDMLQSQAVVDTLLMLMLLAWLGCSAAMTLLAGHAVRRHEAQERRRKQRRHPSHAQPVAQRVARSTRS
jgi:hypothetical protein